MRPRHDPDALFDDDAEPLPAAGGAVEPAGHDEALVRLGRRLPATIHLGTSSWSFPGWQHLVYRGSHTEAQLARTGLQAYAAHPVLRAVGIDRGFYQPLPAQEFARYAAQVPPSFRFVVKAPAIVTDAVTRGAGGSPATANASFLDAALAAERFVAPALAGLGDRCGPLLFQFPPLPGHLLRPAAAAHALIERIGTFFEALPRTVDRRTPVYAVELRDPDLLTPRFVRRLRAAGVRLCIGVHARMPEAGRQSAALRLLDGEEDTGPSWQLRGALVVRWSLHAGLRYEEAKSRYAPFDRIIDPDIVTRGTLVHLAHVAQRSGQPAYVIVNNKAEGCAPATCVELARAIVGA
jgi:uncharacterized protein YecE (DUF72 family)